MEHGIPTTCVHRHLICGVRNIDGPSDIKIYCHYYKMILYGWVEIEECKRGIDELYSEALAIYHVIFMIMLIIEEMPNIVSLFGWLQVQPSLNLWEMDN